jgi:hypothetical protein
MLAKAKTALLAAKDVVIPRQRSDGSANFNIVRNHVDPTFAVEYGFKEVFRTSTRTQTNKFLDRERTTDAMGWFRSHDVKLNLRRTNTTLIRNRLLPITERSHLRARRSRAGQKHEEEIQTFISSSAFHT